MRFDAQLLRMSRFYKETFVIPDYGRISPLPKDTGIFIIGYLICSSPIEHTAQITGGDG